MTIPRPRTADDRTWTCDRCGLEFPSNRKIRGGILPSRCLDCKKTDHSRRVGVLRSNEELAYMLARECTDLRCAMQLALGALMTGRVREARAALESVCGPPILHPPDQPTRLV